MSDFVFERADGSQQIVHGYQYEEPEAGTKQYSETRYKESDLPRKVDLRQHLTVVEDQGRTSSCTANAVAGAYEYLAKKHTGKDYDVSRMFIYYNARAIGVDGDESKIKDGGSGIGKSIQSLQKYGACSEKIYPFDKEVVNKTPYEEAYTEAAQFLIEDAALVPTELYAWKHSLAEGHPIIFGLNLYDSFDKQRKKGLVPLPSESESSREKHGCHAMLAVGYSDVDKVFIVRNSWGTKWGDAGYCYIPYDYLMSKKFNIGDSWIIKQLNNVDFDTEEYWDDNEKSIMDERGSELAKMDDKAYQALLDSMGNYSLEYRIALFFLNAANTDGNLTDEKYSSISVYMTEILESFGIDMDAESILRYAAKDIKNTGLMAESVALLRDHFSTETLTSVMSNMKSVATLDESSAYETSSIYQMLESWEIEESSDEEGESEEGESEEDESEEDESEEDESEEDESEEDESEEDESEEDESEEGESEEDESEEGESEEDESEEGESEEDESEEGESEEDE